ncbi:LemA family protein [Desulfuromonas sp. KJ2020]|uniref:LemA family protein n=1 Tax=Desulfuromonas sp. KJ2020 TaxID=2919173 RepID=UPI0020A80EEE|nr:LemA family protein [Desulfuromonas sp. KJ2020]MCP3175952.1 LemA family protein [Desulfuromonas sp. KJ2020]
MTGWIVFAAFLLILAALILYAVVLYNGFIHLKNTIDKAWSNIDVLLKQRFDELPKLIKVCEGYMQHEQKTLEEVVKARSAINNAGSDQERMGAQNALTETLRSLFMVVERYPDLKADVAFRNLGARISDLEDQIADRRELYNESVTFYNIRLDQFPDLVIARLFHFTTRPLWQIDPAHRQDVQVVFAHH